MTNEDLEIIIYEMAIGNILKSKSPKYKVLLEILLEELSLDQIRFTLNYINVNTAQEVAELIHNTIGGPHEQSHQ